uniref:PHD-type domain-containing protein n=1 Tax=Heliothis virescens TaxID=7102 RepID=A0A2A4J3F1_HELVI
MRQAHLTAASSADKFAEHTRLRLRKHAAVGGLVVFGRHAACYAPMRRSGKPLRRQQESAAPKKLVGARAFRANVVKPRRSRTIRLLTALLVNASSSQITRPNTVCLFIALIVISCVPRTSACVGEREMNTARWRRRSRADLLVRRLKGSIPHTRAPFGPFGSFGGRPAAASVCGWPCAACWAHLVRRSLAACCFRRAGGLACVAAALRLVFARVAHALCAAFCLAGCGVALRGPSPAAAGADATAASADEAAQPAAARKRRRSAPARSERRQGRAEPRNKKAQRKKAEARRPRKGPRDPARDAYDSGSNASSSKSRGPYIQIRGPRDSPLSVSVMNTAAGEEEEGGSRRKGEEFRNGVRVRGLHASTLGLRYDASTPDASWRCAFCARGPHAAALGDLFGPYALDTDCDEYRAMDEATRRRYCSSAGAADEVWFHEACARRARLCRPRPPAVRAAGRLGAARGRLPRRLPAPRLLGRASRRPTRYLASTTV